MEEQVSIVVYSRGRKAGSKNGKSQLVPLQWTTIILWTRLNIATTLTNGIAAFVTEGFRLPKTLNST